MKKKNLILLVSSLIISILILESILRISSNIISRELLTLSSTNVKKLLKEKGFIINENLYKTIKIQNYEFKYYLNSFPSIDDEADIKLGATSLFYFKDGFCNKQANFSKSKIIAVGDSFTYCTSVNPESAWVKQIFKNVELEKKINLGYLVQVHLSTI